MHIWYFRNPIIDHLLKSANDLHSSLDKMSSVYCFDDIPLRKNLLEMSNVTR